MKGEYPGTDSAPLQLIYCIKKTTGSTDGSIKRLLRKLRINRAISYRDQAGKNCYKRNNVDQEVRNYIDELAGIVDQYL